MWMHGTPCRSGECSGQRALDRQCTPTASAALAGSIAISVGAGAIQSPGNVTDNVVNDFPSASGAPVDGAALTIGGAAIFTDSRGRFFHRLSSARAVPLHVLLADFLATGRFEVVTAPATTTPRAEHESQPIRIVVRRVQPDRDAAAASVNRAAPND